MRTILLTIIFQFISFAILSQTNLIQNGGFEISWQNWEQDAETFLCGPWPNNTACFNTTMTQGDDDCASNNNLFKSTNPIDNDFGNQEASEGNTYAGVYAFHRSRIGNDTWRRGKIGYHLSSQLDVNKRYILKFKISKIDKSKNNPKLKVYLNDDFTDPLFNDGEEVLFHKTITDDGSPLNVEWEEVSLRFPVIPGSLDIPRKQVHSFRAKEDR